MINSDLNLNISHLDKYFNNSQSECIDPGKLKGFDIKADNSVANKKRERIRNYYWLRARWEYENFVLYLPKVQYRWIDTTTYQEINVERLENVEHIDSRNLELLRKYNYGEDLGIRRYLMDDLKRYCEQYVNDVSKKVTYYHGERGNERFELFIPTVTRFDKSYMKKQVRRFIDMKNSLELHKSVIFVTLTLDPKYHRTMKEADTFLREKKNLLITRIKSKRPEKKSRRYGFLSDYDQSDIGIRPKYNEKYFRYIYSTETQTANTFNLHYHLMMSFNPPDNSEDVNAEIWSLLDHWIKSMWDSRDFGINEKHRVGDVKVKYVVEKKDPKNMYPYCVAKWYEHGELKTQEYPGTLERYLLKYLYEGFALEDEDHTVNSNNVRLWVANARTFDGTRVSTWRKKNNLPPARGLVSVNNNNSKKFNFDENLELEITWHYGGRFLTYEIGGLKGLYKDEQLDASTLELLYRRISIMFDAG